MELLAGRLVAVGFSVKTVAIVEGPRQRVACDETHVRAPLRYRAPSNRVRLLAHHQRDGKENRVRAR